MDKATKGGLAVGALLLAMLLGNSLTGLNPIGYHADCMDNVDNDQDGMIDGMDYECTEYPYADGNGEDYTPKNQQYSDDSYKSLFEYHRDYMDPLSNEQIDAVCFHVQTGKYSESDGEKFTTWSIENNVNCETAGP